MRLLLVNEFEPLHDELGDPGQQKEREEEETEAPVPDPPHGMTIAHPDDIQNASRDQTKQEPRASSGCRSRSW